MLTVGKSLRLKESRRARFELSYAWGYVIFEEPPESVKIAAGLIGEGMVITVGDIVTESFLRYFRSDLAVVDERSRRKPLGGRGEAPSPVYACENPPSTISAECVSALERAMAQAARGSRAVLVVRGEEDLLSLPAIILCPEGGWVAYGNWRGFLCLIPCTATFRRVARGLLEAFFEEQRADQEHVASQGAHGEVH